MKVHIDVKDVNDNKPIFGQRTYHASVAENAQLNPPAAVLQVNAQDADDGIFGDVKYAITSNDNNLFQLDPNSGILYPSKSLKGMEGKTLGRAFDDVIISIQSIFSFAGQYKLRVEARDGLGSGPFADEAEIIIDVASINNYRPVFIMPALSNASVELQEVKLIVKG